MEKPNNGMAKVHAMKIGVDESKLMPTSKEDIAIVEYLEDQMPIPAKNNSVEIDIEKGTITRKDSNGKVISVRELSSEEKLKYKKREQQKDTETR
jgi:hypothetical protein